MSSGFELSQELASYLYKLEDIRLEASAGAECRPGPSACAMLLFREADGELAIDGRVHPLGSRKIFLLAPGADVRLTGSSGGGTKFYFVRFCALQAAGPGRFESVRPRFPDECPVPYFEAVWDKVRETEKSFRSPDVWENMKANASFQETIAALFKDLGGTRAPDLREAIRLTLEYIDRNYMQPITREQLAAMAGLNGDYYSRAFKKQTGKSPMEYLTEVRMNEAKRLLSKPGESLRAVAHGVGFSDEFYFSRKFKADTGYSPRAYVKKLKSSGKIASLNHLVTGNLIALNVEPYAAVRNDAFPVGARLGHTIAVGGARPDLDRLMSAKPDLIVASGFRAAELSPEEKVWNQIAPTVTLPFASDWISHFKMVARIVNKEKEAGDWLERYARKAEIVRKQIGERVGDDTFLVVGLAAGKLYAYGRRNIGTVLYGDLGLNAPPGAADIHHFKEISKDELAFFDADRILLTCFRHDGTARTDRAIRSEADALFACEQWRSLKAVRNRRVYEILNTRHLYTSYNALSHDLLLDKARQLLAP